MCVGGGALFPRVQRELWLGGGGVKSNRRRGFSLYDGMEGISSFGPKQLVDLQKVCYSNWLSAVSVCVCLCVLSRCVIEKRVLAKQKFPS